MITATLALAIVIFLVFSAHFLPMGWGSSPTMSFYMESLNLANRPVSQSYLLSEPGLNLKWDRPPSLYTHNPNLGRLVGVVLLKCGITQIRPFTICTISIGTIAILALVAGAASTTAITIQLLGLLLWFLCDYLSLTSFFDAYYIWNYIGFFVFLYVLIRKPKAALCFALFFLVSLTDLFLTLFGLFGVVFYFLIQERRSLRLILASLGGVATGFLSFVGLLIWHYGFTGLMQDFFGTYHQRQDYLTQYVSFASLRVIYSRFDVASCPTPVTEWDTMRHLFAATYGHNGPLATFLLVAGVFYALVEVARKYRREATDDSSAALLVARLLIAFVLSGGLCLAIFRGYVTSVYLYWVIPMWNLVYALGFVLSIHMLVRAVSLAPSLLRIRRLITVAVFILVFGAFAFRNQALFRKYPLFDDHSYFTLAAAAKESTKLYTTAPWPYMVLDWEATGMQPLYFGDKMPDRALLKGFLAERGTLVHIVDSKWYFGSSAATRWLGYAKSEPFSAEFQPSEIYSSDSAKIIRAQ